MTQKILITGASGFVGSRLTTKLVDLNFDVHALVRHSSNLWRLNNLREKISLHNADLSAQKQVSDVIQRINPDVVFHFACYGGFPNEADEERIMTVNTLGTYYLLQACSKTGTKKFFHIGSSSEYGIKSYPMSEDDLERPVNIYGISKLATSNIVRLYAESGKLPSTILRIFSPYGIYDDARRLIPTVINACLLNKELRLGSGKQVRDFIFIEDLIDAFILALERAPLNGEIINLGFGEQHTVKEVVNIILKECKYPIMPVWSAFADRKNEPQIWYSNNTLAKKILGWQPKIALHDGLSATILWTKNQLKNEGK